jgi:hypothetical protein
MVDGRVGLPKSDWILLPALSLLTMALMIGACELTARILFAESKTTTLQCLVVNDASTGVRAIPNTACSQKIPESELVTYTINSCGHRAGMECLPKAADTYRIVMVGSSFNYGMWMRREQSFAALLPEELARRTGRKIELYNEAMQWGYPRSVDLRFKEVLAAKPDMILWPLTPVDIASVDLTLPWTGPPPFDPKDPTAGIWNRLRIALTSKSPTEFVADAWKRLAKTLNETHTVFLLQHEIFKSQSLFVKQYLMQPDASDYLRRDQTAEFQQHLASFAHYFSDVEAQAKSIGATVVVVVLPERAQAAMISMKEWPEDFDPYKLGSEVESIVTSRGGKYVDILSAFRSMPNPEQNFMPVDGHPTADGHAVISRLLAQALTDGEAPALWRGR